MHPQDNEGYNIHIVDEFHYFWSQGSVLKQYLTEPGIRNRRILRALSQKDQVISVKKCKHEIYGLHAHMP